MILYLISNKYQIYIWYFGYISEIYLTYIWYNIRYISDIIDIYLIFFLLKISKYRRKYLKSIQIISKKYQFFEKKTDIYHISRVLLTLGGGLHGFTPFWHFFYYIRLFRAPRRFLGAVKIATESWECILSDSQVWSTGVDLLGNISIPFGIVQL